MSCLRLIDKQDKQNNIVQFDCSLLKTLKKINSNSNEKIICNKKKLIHTHL